VLGYRQDGHGCHGHHKALTIPLALVGIISKTRLSRPSQPIIRLKNLSLILVSFSTSFPTYKYPSLPPSFFHFSFFSSSYLPCLGGRDHEGGPPRVGPCIAQRGGTVRPTAFGSLAGIFFGTFPSFFSLTTSPSCVVLKKRKIIA
jgi:hypothetical protein